MPKPTGILVHSTLTSKQKEMGEFKNISLGFLLMAIFQKLLENMTLENKTKADDSKITGILKDR
jgi:hypothetical protein